MTVSIGGATIAGGITVGDAVSFVTSGLSYYLDTTQFTGSNPTNITNIPPGSIWTLNNFTVGTGASITTLQSNCDATGAGTSNITVTRDVSFETGSMTFQIWYNLEGVPLDVGANNNWRALLGTPGGTAGSPLSSVQEESYIINFSTTHTDMYRRYLNSNFAPVTKASTGWQLVTYTYDKVTGQAAAYLNGTLQASGPMTSDAAGSNPTTAGTALSYVNYQSNGFRIYGGTNTGPNPSGEGVVPGEVGNILFYNRALSAAEVLQNYNGLKARYGL
jgi:hypothetical protein